MPAKPAKAAKATRPAKAAKAAAAKPRASAKPRTPKAVPAAVPEPETVAWGSEPADAPAPALAPPAPAQPPVQVVSWGIAPPPGWQAPPAAAFARRPTRGLAGALVVLLAVSVGLAVLNLGAMAVVEDWGQPGADPGIVALQTLVSMGSGGASIALVVVFCMWLHRTLSNAASRHPAAGIRPGWAVGSFFIPVAHLVLPFIEVRRGWRADVSIDDRPVVWWFVPWALSILAAYVATVLAMAVAFRTFMSAFDADRPDPSAIYEEMRPLQLLSGAISVPLQALAAYFLARLARQWTDHQEGPPVS